MRYLKPPDEEICPEHAEEADEVGVEGQSDDEFGDIQIDRHRCQIENGIGFHQERGDPAEGKTGDEFADYAADYRAENEEKGDKPEAFAGSVSHDSTSRNTKGMSIIQYTFYRVGVNSLQASEHF